LEQSEGVSQRDQHLITTGDIQEKWVFLEISGRIDQRPLNLQIAAYLIKTQCLIQDCDAFDKCPMCIDKNTPIG
jgi:hypothetical protein